MAKYTVTITNQKRRGQELIEVHEYDGAPIFSKDMYENTVASMFFFAAQSIDYRCLDAVVDRDGKKVLHFTMDTHADGCYISATLKAARPREKYRYIRTMTIAD